MWSKEQVDFIKEYMDQYQFSKFLIEKDREVDNILYYIKDGFLDINAFSRFPEQLNLLKSNYENLTKKLENKKELLEKEYNKKNSIVSTIKTNTAPEIKEIYEKKYKKIIEHKKDLKLTFQNKTLTIFINQYVAKKKKMINTINKILKINYIIMLLSTSLYTVYLFVK